MVQGTASGAGKSLLVTALCRILARHGHRVAPFKAQNMSLNAAVTRDGGEIGRAQASQAEAAGIEPTVDMNPILLKPEGDDCSQLVVRGRACGRVSWAAYRALLPGLRDEVAGALARLRREHDVLVIEGAGSPAEINLRDADLVNMPVARLADAPVLLVGDIDRGGVFAAFVGTLALLPLADRGRVAGLVVNRFRGDAAILRPGLVELQALTGVPVLGVVPWLADHGLPAEDSLDLDGRGARGPRAHVEVAVVRLPRLANFDDFDWLGAEPGVAVRFVTSPGAVEGADLVVLPGSKSTIADLHWLRERGLDRAIHRAAATGRVVLGVCGGYQMLGRAVHDPDGVDGRPGTVAGLGLLPVVTTFAAAKTTVPVRARVLAAGGPFDAARGAEVEAYEIHAGRTIADPGARRPFRVVERGGRAAEELDGAVRPDGAVLGTYLHGVLASAALRRALLGHVVARAGRAALPGWGVPAPPATRYDRLADAVAAALDLPAIGRLAGLALGATRR